MSEYFRKYIKKNNYSVHYSQIKFKTYFTNCVQSALLNREYKQTEDNDWDIYWCEKHLIAENLDLIRLYPNKKINHFRNFYEICRKDLLSKNIKRYKKTLEKQGKVQEAATYNFAPLTYNLPMQYPIFYEQFKRNKQKENSIWIMKPIGQSQGKGIFLFKNINDIIQWSDMKIQNEPYIVQRYIHNPLLIGFKKFDIRIYVLVTSHAPLTIYLYRSGFGRFTHYRYDTIDIYNTQCHLTNVAIQKNTNNYDQQKGGKYLLDKLKLYLIAKYGQTPTNQCFLAIQQLVIKTLISTSKLIIHDKRCFQLYGFDVLIDENLKPWLIEVNGSPSMTANTQHDKILKVGLLDDVLTIINMEQLLTGQQQQIGGFDLIYKTKLIQKTGNKISMLGCINNRMYQLRKLAKSTALKQSQKPKIQQQKPKIKNRFIYNANKAAINSNSVKKVIVSNDANLKLPKIGGNSAKMITDKIIKAKQIVRLITTKDQKR